MSYAVQKYKTEIWESVKTLWSVWVPLQLINFAFVPRHMRVPYVAGVSFGWTMILSVMQGKFDKAARDGKDTVTASKELSEQGMAAQDRQGAGTGSGGLAAAAPVAAQSKEVKAP